MCIAAPGKIKNITKDKAIVDFNGTKIEASNRLKPTAKVGDYVLVHAGFIIEIVDEKDALKTLACFEEIENA
ncbi:MAG: HypC/HybG/HupF family hydrogenase formation chaperone [Elusimicrobiaceae bacterium]|jgi:hydrogenase expression/formation protein HypC|nr:HypC/HybG/HupF family hydrogenase formation chaperone [Elusimicrobiaceae bacterium]MBT3955047.1 HypC/HybG/HupF family hydrogenase formation chaperone [Elusimicrobiaceae bacterium]MBT4007845.1 HypC/HybG/HupF family hydrogenase formation chaperone [Elusimicrobiaceae bacterium]MBT5986961.1 HypC/HybG/HupF family hydrogenase formation chaperone [Elusimicrobiaceae bacterium]